MSSKDPVFQQASQLYPACQKRESVVTEKNWPKDEKQACRLLAGEYPHDRIDHSISMLSLHQMMASMKRAG